MSYSRSASTLTIETCFSREQSYLHVNFYDRYLTYATESENVGIPEDNTCTIDEFRKLIKQFCDTLDRKLEMLFV